MVTPADALWPADADRSVVEQSPGTLEDLNLDQVVEALVKGREEHDLATLFRGAPRDETVIRHRQAVFADVEDPEVGTALRAFATAMARARALRREAARLRFRYQRQGWQHEAVAAYCAATRELLDGLESADLASEGLRATRTALREVVAGEHFRSVEREAEEVAALLDEVVYCVHIQGLRVQVTPYAGQPDYSAEVARTFAVFRDGPVAEHAHKLGWSGHMNHVEARILDLVGRLYPEAFAALARFCERHADFADHRVDDLDRHAGFYLAYLDLLTPLRTAGLPLCYPALTTTPGETGLTDGYDLALASAAARPSSVVTNGFDLADAERVVVVTGPNQGGKTTFGRMVGQVHHLAGLGCPVPAASARLLHADGVRTHFRGEERLATQRSGLEEDLEALQSIVSTVSPRTVVVLNEALSSTTVQDALEIGDAVLDELADNAGLTLLVTFIDELAGGDPRRASYVAGVDPVDPTVRTLRIERRPADGRSYALALAERHGLTYRQLSGDAR